MLSRLRAFTTILALGCLFQTSVFCLEPGIITTIAGNGREEFTGDGGPATEAGLGWSVGVCADGEGNIFIADTGNYRVRRIGTDGVITTVAGNGLTAPIVDGVLATTAAIYPASVWVDAQGNLYIADILSGQIKRVGADGILTIVAGKGDRKGNPGWVFNGDNIAAIQAGISFSMLNGNGICTDSVGNLFIADKFNHRVRRVDTQGIITTVVGSGVQAPFFNGDNIPAVQAHLSQPGGVYVDAAGNLFISDAMDFRVRRVDSEGIITTVAGNGTRSFNGVSEVGKPATQISLGAPGPLCSDREGNLFFAVSSSDIICRVDVDGILTIIAGTPNVRGYNGDNLPATEALLDAPSGLFLDAQGNLLVAEHNRIRCIKGAASAWAVHPQGNQPQSWAQVKRTVMPSILASSPQPMQVFPNFPNPFNAETWIPYQLSQRATVTIDIYDVRGRLIRRLALGEKHAGIYTDPTQAAYWDGRSDREEQVASGVYLYRLHADDVQSQPRTMLLMK